MDWVINALQKNPELAIFLTLAIGFAIGKVRLGSFSLGIVVGTLLAGVLVGQIGIEVSPVVKSVFFSLFLFTTGYKVGPQFFRALKKDAMPQVALTVVLCGTCLLVAVAAALLFGYDIGTAAGLLAGAFSESTVIGTAGEAIQRLGLPDAEKKDLVNNIPVAYAVTYLLGTAVLVWFIPTIGPRLLGIDLREEAKKMQAQAAEGGASDAPIVSAARRFDIRAYRVTNDELVDRSVGELEATPRKVRIFVMRLRRAGRILEVDSRTVIRRDDVVAIATRHKALVEQGTTIGPEVDDQELVDIPLLMQDVVVTNKSVDGITLGELARRDFARGVFLDKLVRSGQEMPVDRHTVIDRGDLLRLVGTRSEVERASQEIGYTDRPTNATDMIFVGTGIVLGGLVGLLSVNVYGMPITLTASGGALVMGLVFGWLRSKWPVFGRIPEPAVWIFDTLGLCVFIGVVGIGAGPGFVSGLRETGISLVLVGLVCALIPHTVAMLFGRFVLRMNPVVLLGACAGAGTITAALRALQEQAQSKLPALGYTVPYAIGNILLTAWGPVIVAILWLIR